MKRNCGFTLVELLIVIAIISILLAMLLPILKGARDTARTVSCANSFKQIHLAHDIYTSDFGSWTPVVRVPDGSNCTWNFWKHLVGSYAGLTPDLPWGRLPGGWTNLPKCIAEGKDFPNTDYARGINKNMGVFDCPAQDMSRKYDATYQQEKYNEVMVNEQVLNKRVQALSPRQVLVADANDAYKTYIYWSTQVTYCHRNKTAANYVFIDGHIETTWKYRTVANTNFAPWTAP